MQQDHKKLITKNTLLDACFYLLLTNCAVLLVYSRTMFGYCLLLTVCVSVITRYCMSSMLLIRIHQGYMLPLCRTSARKVASMVAQKKVSMALSQ